MRVRTRPLWVRVRYSVPDQTLTRSEIIRTLIRSVERGDYRLPRAWRVAIEWRNKEDAPMRRGRWQDELERSAASSSGFDKAVLDYLRSQL